MKHGEANRRTFLASVFGVQVFVRQLFARSRSPRDEEREKLDRLAAKYGSELGNLRKAGR